MFQTAQTNLIRELQKDILSLQKPVKAGMQHSLYTGLGELEAAFPDHVFPTSAVHEFISKIPEDAAATNGFMCGLLGRLLMQKGACLWISAKRTIFPPALKVFGIEPQHIIFVDLQRPKDVLWAIEEGLKCETLSAVVGELSELSFTESRRLQLAVETSRVTGFIHRYNPRQENTTACVTRWKIKPLPSESDMPGLGLPRWNVQLQKVRNGKPGTWQFEWSDTQFRHIIPQRFTLHQSSKQKTG